MTKQRIQELKKLCEQATPGPWEFDGAYPGEFNLVTSPGNVVIDCDEYYAFCKPDDRAFIATARTALPEALDEIERLQTEIKALEIVKSEMHNFRNKWLSLQEENAKLINLVEELKVDLEVEEERAFQERMKDLGRIDEFKEETAKLRAALEKAIIGLNTARTHLSVLDCDSSIVSETLEIARKALEGEG